MTCPLCHRALATSKEIEVNGQNVQVCGDADGCRRTVLAERVRDKPVTRTEDVAHNRQTRMADAALDLLKEHPEYGDERLMVFLDGKETSAIGISGYGDDPNEPMVNLFMHLRAMFAANGKELTLMGMDKRMGQG